MFTLVCRLVLSLSHAANTRDDSEFTRKTNLEPPQFASGPFLGNIGGPVRSLPDRFYDEEIEDDVPADTNEIQDDRSRRSDTNDPVQFGGEFTTSGRNIEEIATKASEN